MIKAKRVLDLPRVSAEILWTHGYYDGPLSGMVMYEGRMCWFATTDDPGLPKRRYFLYDLEDEEVVKIVTRHIEFEMLVGTHNCRHAPGSVKDRATHMQFYDKYKNVPDETKHITATRRPFARFIRNPRKS